MTTVAAPSRRRRRPHPAAARPGHPPTRGGGWRQNEERRQGETLRREAGVPSDVTLAPFRPVTSTTTTTITTKMTTVYVAISDPPHLVLVWRTCDRWYVCCRVVGALWLQGRYIAIRTFANVGKLTLLPSPDTSREIRHRFCFLLHQSRGSLQDPFYLDCD